MFKNISRFGKVMVMAAVALIGINVGGCASSGSYTGSNSVTALNGKTYDPELLEFTGMRQNIAQGEAGQFHVKKSAWDKVSSGLLSTISTGGGAYGGALAAKSAGGGTLAQIGFGGAGGAAGNAVGQGVFGNDDPNNVWCLLNQPALMKYASAPAMMPTAIAGLPPAAPGAPIQGQQRVVGQVIETTTYTPTTSTHVQPVVAQPVVPTTPPTTGGH